MFEMKTRRLHLKIPAAEHTTALHDFLNNPQVSQWLGGSRSEEGIVKLIEKESQHWLSHQFGPWLAFNATSNKLIGRGGIRYVEIQSVQEVELFYAIHPAYWKQGLATELAFAALDLAGENENIASLVAFTTNDNQASQRVIQKAGFKYERNFEHADCDHTLFRFDLSAISMARLTSQDEESDRLSGMSSEVY